MITKNEEEDIMEQAIGSKIADYLIKPVNPNQILLSIKKNIDSNRLVTEKTNMAYQSDFGNIGQQISEAMDKTATAITEAAHNKVVERIRKGEEIVYKKPDAIERAKQDDRYQVEINDKGHAVVKNIKDNLSPF